MKLENMGFAKANSFFLKNIKYYLILKIMLDIKQIKQAVSFIAKEKNIASEKIIEIIEQAIKTAYKKDYGNRDNEVNVRIDLENEKIEVNIEKTVVKEVQNPAIEISFEELWDQAEDFEEWDVIEIDVTDEIQNSDAGESFWRIASQAARQVIIQKMSDSEKEKIYDLFEWKEWQAINLKVELVEWNKVIFDYNWNQIVLPKSEQVSRDNYIAGARFYLYIDEVSKNEIWKPKVVLTRKKPELVSAIFAENVPEMWEGVIKVDNIVRYPWVKTKILVSSIYDEIDPVGTLIWQKWIRVKSVMEELWWEKIDIIANSGDLAEIIKKSLSPAEILKVEIDEEDELANVYILPSERAKAVWKNGLNVNLASKLTWYRISIIDIEKQEEK